LEQNFRNQNEKEILKRAQRGNKITRMRPRFPRFLLPLIIGVLVVAIIAVPIFIDFGPELSFNILEVFANKDDEIKAEVLTDSNLKEFSVDNEIKIKEDEFAINGIILTPDVDYEVNGTIESSFKTLIGDIKEKGLNSVFFNLNYNDGYLTAVGGKKNNTPVSDALKLIAKETKANDIRLFVVLDIKSYNILNSKDLADLLAFITELQKTDGVFGVMLKGLDIVNHTLSYNDYIKLGYYGNYESFLNDIFISNLTELVYNFKTANKDGYLGLFCEADYDIENEKLIEKDKLLATELINLNLFDSVLTFGFGSTASASHPFSKMTNALNDGIKNTGTRLGFMVYSSKINTDYSNPDQLTRQLMVLDDIGNGMVVFDNYKSLVEDSSGAAATALKYLRGSLSNYQPKGLTFSTPSSLDFTTSYNSLAISGASDPEFELLLDGKPVERTESGFFSMQKDLKVGDNTFTFTHKNVTRKITVAYYYKVLKDVSPIENISLNGGSTLVIKATARIGSKVTATLNGKTVTLKQGVDQSEDSTEKDSEFTVFEGSITLPTATDKEQNLGTIKFTATHGGIVNTGNSGTIKVKKKPAESPIYTPIIHEGVKPGKQKIAEVISSYVETFSGDTTDDYSRPTNTYLPKGTIDYVSEVDIYDAASGSVYVNLGYNKRVYSNKGGINISTGSLPESNSVGIKSATNQGQYTTIVLDMAFPFPHNIDVKPQSYKDEATQDYTFSETSFTYVEVFLPYTTTVSGNLNLSGNPLFSKGEFAKSDKGYLLKLHLKNKGKFYGYTSYFDESGNLVLKFLNPKPISGNNLAGVNILLDPGHGGSDPGAVYTDNKGKEIKESKTCLELCLAVKEKLTALGANVSLTRSSESSLASSTRSAIIRASNAHLTVSIHRNAANNVLAHGVKTYHFNAWQKEPAETILNAFKENEKIKAFHPTKPIPQNWSFTTSAWVRTDWHWFGYARISNMPVVLIEAGFMSNATDLEAILRDDFNDAQADAIVNGIVKYFNNQ